MMCKMRELNAHEELEELAECAACPENVMLAAALKILDDGSGNTGALDRDEAKKYVDRMLDANGLHVGETWSMDTVRDVLAGRGMDDELLEMYVAMNMIKADFGRALTRHGADDVELVVEMAHDWIHDPDAKTGKLGRYMREIAK